MKGKLPFEGKKTTPGRLLLIDFSHNNNKYDCLTSIFLSLNCCSLDIVPVVVKILKFSKQLGLNIDEKESFK